MGRLGGKLLSPAGLVVLVCFFMPWVTVSCGGAKTALTETSAYTILAGNVEGQQRQEGNPDFYLIIGGAIVLILVGLVLWNRRSTGASVVAVLASLAIFAQTLYFYFRLPGAIEETTGVSMEQVTIVWHPAFWVTVITGALAVVASLASFGQDPRSS